LRERVDGELLFHAGSAGQRGGRELLGMAQPEVLGEQVLEEPERPGAVGERMENLQGDPVSAVQHSEQQVTTVETVEVGHRWGDVFGDHRMPIGLLQVVPEDALAQHRPEQWVLRIDPVEGLLQDRRIDHFVQLGGQPEDLRVDITARGEEDVRGVVEPHPGRRRRTRPPGGRMAQPWGGTGRIGSHGVSRVRLSVMSPSRNPLMSS